MEESIILVHFDFLGKEKHWWYGTPSFCWWRVDTDKPSLLTEAQKQKNIEEGRGDIDAEIKAKREEMIKDKKKK